MQDDLTDATRWAIAQGIADKERICLYGASYGGYASLMGVAKEPTLYQCAAGYVGVYDLPKMQADDKRDSQRGWATGSTTGSASPTTLGAVSPNRMADRIKVPVFLAAGGEDERAPIEHSKMMEAGAAQGRRAGGDAVLRHRRPRLLRSRHTARSSTRACWRSCRAASAAPWRRPVAAAEDGEVAREVDAVDAQEPGTSANDVLRASFVLRGDAALLHAVHHPPQQRRQRRTPARPSRCRSTSSA